MVVAAGRQHGQHENNPRPIFASGQPSDNKTAHLRYAQLRTPLGSHLWYFLKRRTAFRMAWVRCPSLSARRIHWRFFARPRRLEPDAVSLGGRGGKERDACSAGIGNLLPSEHFNGLHLTCRQMLGRFSGLLRVLALNDASGHSSRNESCLELSD